MSDSGIGIAPKDIEKIFDRFFRVPRQGDQAGEGGSGLGLSIAQWIVTAHQGGIHFSSAPDKLTVVSVRLPLTSLVN